ncbi:MAG: DNA mismatch repair protein MutS [Acidobacteriota bacterium]
MTPLEEYTARHQRWSTEFARVQRRQHILGNARLVTGLALAVVAAASLGPAWISPWWLLGPGIALVIMMSMHPRTVREFQRAARSVAYYGLGLARLQNRWAGQGRQGEDLRDPRHMYADDLDVFGRGSLFELLSTARTGTGERTLSAWLLAPGQHVDVVARQTAVRELAPKLDLREDLAVIGEDIRSALDDRRLAAWGALPPVAVFRGARLIAFLLSIAGAATGIVWIAGEGIRPFLYVAAVEILFGWAIRKPIFEITQAVNTPARELRLIALLLDRLEKEPATSPALVALRERLRLNGSSATAHIRRLQRLVEWMEWAYNQVFAVLSAPLLWIPQFAMAIEAWRLQCGPHIADWIAAVGEYEALGSLAAFTYEHPAAVFPELLAGPQPVYQAADLAHPLIAAEEAVANDVALGGDTGLWIISGSNMSGKSTLLRAVGLSVAMAWAGAPVTAKSLRLARLQVGASLRANDSLADHQSRFYAEIRRLKAIVDAAGADPQVLFLLDELLSGTNSHDRRIGAEALLKGLLERGAIGLTTTHDLALAEMADGLSARNVHFEDQFEGGKIHWDYRLRPGVVQRGNALELMRAVGLDV